MPLDLLAWARKRHVAIIVRGSGGCPRGLAGRSGSRAQHLRVPPAISVVAEEDYPLWDLRIDDAEDPAAEHRRLFGLFQEQVLPSIRRLPTRDDRLGQAAREQLADQ